MRRGTHEHYLHHVTLTSGHVRRSPRSDVSDEVVVLLQSLLGRVLLGGVAPVPGLPELRLVGDETAHYGYAEAWIVAAGDDPVLTLGVAARSRSGAALWRRLHEARGELATAGQPCPPEPWCAARLEAAAASLDADTMVALGDFGRCLAWAWLEEQD